MNFLQFYVSPALIKFMITAIMIEPASVPVNITGKRSTQARSKGLKSNIDEIKLTWKSQKRQSKNS